MKITERKLQQLIRESIFKRIFGKKEKEVVKTKEELPPEIASDFGGGEIVDDFIIDDESGEGFETNRRSFIKGTAAIAGAAASGFGGNLLYQHLNNLNTIKGFENLSPDEQNQFVVQDIINNITGFEKLSPDEQNQFISFFVGEGHSLFLGIEDEALEAIVTEMNISDDEAIRLLENNVEEMIDIDSSLGNGIGYYYVRGAASSTSINTGAYGGLDEIMEKLDDTEVIRYFKNVLPGLNIEAQ